MLNKLPTISIISNTYNPPLQLFKRSLEAINRQDYPKEAVEYILMDAGSRDATLELAKSYKCKIVSRPDLLHKEQTRVSLGIKMAKNEFILMLHPDNILMGKDWLAKITQPFIEDEKIFCTFSMHNGFLKDMPALTKYFAFFGTNDALLYYLDKVEKMPLDETDYNKGKIIKRYKNYYVVRFTQEDLPPLGDNGSMFKKKIIDKVNKNPEKFIHVDAFAHLVGMGFDTFGVVKNSIIHYSGSNIIDQYKRRVAVKRLYYDQRRNERVYFTFNPSSRKDVWNLLKFILFSLTFVQPLIRSLKGYIKLREFAWFLHPIVCFVALLFYVQSECQFLIRRRLL